MYIIIELVNLSTNKRIRSESSKNDAKL